MLLMKGAQVAPPCPPDGSRHHAVMPDHARPDVQARLRAAIVASYRESTLGQWMASHRVEMVELQAGGEVDWEAAASLFGKAGLLDALGKPPVAATAEATWLMLETH